MNRFYVGRNEAVMLGSFLKFIASHISSTFCIAVITDEPECPKSLIK